MWLFRCGEFLDVSYAVPGQGEYLILLVDSGVSAYGYNGLYLGHFVLDSGDVRFVSHQGRCIPPFKVWVKAVSLLEGINVQSNQTD